MINDLHRNAIAYRLFQVICFVFKLNEMPRDDGLISILRGFKKKELVNYSNELKFKDYNIQWKWAFRYQWIISKILMDETLFEDAYKWAEDAIIKSSHSGESYFQRAEVLFQTAENCVGDVLLFDDKVVYAHLRLIYVGQKIEIHQMCSNSPESHDEIRLH